ncbi:hypothetical protein MBRA1_000609 [Malassezia brasiliensis]|uniref:Uncharacterized protein n=1 Tax=Malassezia brasiliensis TaxID=1821822 RepID=A0AAF0DR95_9BASI|nr:hypothetical protein MBRA1_000609 [Malassezia brasiliensis]
MVEILSDLEATDADARAQDMNAALQGRLTGAKLLVSAAYVFLDVIWIHMELERVHTYFTKLKKAERADGGTGESAPSQRIDAAAASRMVTAAAGEKRKHTRFDEEEEKPNPEKSGKTKNTSTTSELNSKIKSKKTKKKETTSNLETFAQDTQHKGDVKMAKDGEKASKSKHKTDTESKKKKKKTKQA